MRIIVAGPPKTGNTWSKCLLSETYRLRVLRNEPKSTAELKRKLARGWFRNGSIFHQHLWPSDGFFEAVEGLDPYIVTCLRNPYDAFVSLYFFVQNSSRRFKSNKALGGLVGKPIDHPDVLDYIQRIERGFGADLRLGLAWISSGCSLVLRYEDLHADPAAALGKLTEQISPVETALTRQSVEACSFKKMHKKRQKSLRGMLFGRRYADHLRKGRVGDSKKHLTPANIEAFQAHRGLIRALGYEVITNQK